MSDYSKINNPCETHFNFEGAVCPVCQQKEIEKLHELVRECREYILEHELDCQDEKALELENRIYNQLEADS